MKRHSDPSLKFPCDCFTESPECEEPWALIAKRGVFKGGTKEKILNLLHEQPRTIAQLSDSLDMSQPTIHRHLNGLISGGLITELDEVQKNYSVERYYRPSFPVVNESDHAKFERAIDEMAEEMADVFRSRARLLLEMFRHADADRSGWTFEEFSQFLLQASSRMARHKLEETGELAASLHGSEEGILFWAVE